MPTDLDLSPKDHVALRSIQNNRRDLAEMLNKLEEAAIALTELRGHNQARIASSLIAASHRMCVQVAHRERDYVCAVVGFEMAQKDATIRR